MFYEVWTWIRDYRFIQNFTEFVYWRPVLGCYLNIITGIFHALGKRSNLVILNPSFRTLIPQWSQQRFPSNKIVVRYELPHFPEQGKVARYIHSPFKGVTHTFTEEVAVSS